VCGSNADQQDCTQYCGSTSVGLGMRFVATDAAHVKNESDPRKRRPPPKPQPSRTAPDCRLDGGQ
jgi:hypothetical protein